MSFREELERFRDNQKRTEKVEQDAIALGKFIIKSNLRSDNLSWRDVLGARSLRDLGVDIPWVHAVANAIEESNLDAVTEIALIALEEEGEE